MIGATMHVGFILRTKGCMIYAIVVATWDIAIRIVGSGWLPRMNLQLLAFLIGTSYVHVFVGGCGVVNHIQK